MSDVCEVLAVMLSSSLWNLRFVVASAGGDAVEVGAIPCWRYEDEIEEGCMGGRALRAAWQYKACGDSKGRSAQSGVLAFPLAAVCQDPIYFVRETKAMTRAVLAKVNLLYGQSLNGMMHLHCQRTLYAMRRILSWRVVVVFGQ